MNMCASTIAGVEEQLMKRLMLFLLLPMLMMPTMGWAQPVPQICIDGFNYRISLDFKRSIQALTQCLKTNSLDTVNEAITYQNRAISYYSLAIGFLYPNRDKAADEKGFELLESAYDDIQKSINLDPSIARSYCMRGHIRLEISEGWDDGAYDDWDKGIAMGAPKDVCKAR